MKRKDFGPCIEENELFETGVKDLAMAKELLKLAEHREQFWDEIKKEEKYPSLYLEGHYEIIKELATAILALDGWKALSHECLFAYFKARKRDLELDFDYLLELKDIRNNIDYRGAFVTHNLWKNNKMRIELTIKTLKEHIKERLEERD